MQHLEVSSAVQHIYMSLISSFRRVQNLVPMKMEQIECSETSAYINQTPGNYPKENTLYICH